MRRFVIRPPATTQLTATVAAEVTDIPELAFDWSETELQALANVASEADINDCRAWLTRLGIAGGVELFDA